jgi:flagellar motor switch protein FliM
MILSVPLVASFVDRLLGGRSAPQCEESALHSPLTEVDQRLAARLNEAIRQSMSEAAEVQSLLEFAELSGCANSLIEAWLPDCPLVRLSFDLRFVQGGGQLELLLPCEIADSLVDQNKATDIGRTPLDQLRADCPNVSAPRAVIVAQLSQTSLSKCDLRSLAVGDVLLMPSPVDQTVRVFVDGRPEFAGIAGISGGRKAIRLTNVNAARAS